MRPSPCVSLCIRAFVVAALLAACTQAPPAGPAPAPVMTEAPTPEQPAPAPTAIPPQPTALPGALPSASPAPSASATPGEQSGELPPGDLLEAMQEKIASGEWTYEQGLVTTLKIFTGESDPAQLFGAREPDGEGFSTLLAEASRYAESGPDAAARAEVKRLLGAILPDSERVLKYAQPQPAGPAAGGGAGLAAPAQQGDPVKCQELAADGFPDVTPPIMCFQYLERALPVGKVRVFYPLAWWPSDPRLKLAEAVADSALDSTNTYKKFTPGKMQAVDVVFVLLYHPSSPKALMGTSPVGNAPTCRIAVYPPGTAPDVKVDEFKEVLAHEMFHCYSEWNLSAKYDHALPAANAYWLEGAATYFMNVVYPTVNAEWSKVPRFDQRSVNTPINRMSYEDFVFWHYLANRLGDQKVIDLLKTLPDSDEPAAHAQALEAYPGMQKLFHDFGRAYLDGTIADRGGGMLPTHYQLAAADLITIGAPTTAHMEAAPLLLRRYLITFVPKKRFGLKTTDSGADGLSGARLRPTPGAWPGLPEEAGAGCGAEQYLFLDTTTAPGEAAHTVALEATFLRDVSCDKCLVGTWNLDKASYFTFFQTSMGTSGAAELNGVGGNLQLIFKNDGTYQGTFDNLTVNFTIHQKDPLGNPLDVVSIVRFNGAVDATYWTDDQGHLLGKNNAFDVTVQVTVNGHVASEQSVKPGQAGGLSEDPDTYTCSQDRLTISHELRGKPASLDYVRAGGAP